MPRHKPRRCGRQRQQRCGGGLHLGPQRRTGKNRDALSLFPFTECTSSGRQRQQRRGRAPAPQPAAVHKATGAPCLLRGTPRAGASASSGVAEACTSARSAARSHTRRSPPAATASSRHAPPAARNAGRPPSCTGGSSRLPPAVYTCTRQTAPARLSFLASCTRQRVKGIVLHPVHPVLLVEQHRSIWRSQESK